MVNSPDETKDSAQSHTPRTPPLAAALEAFTDPLSEAAAVDDAAPAGDDAPAADGGLDLTMKKKKKKKVVKEDDEAGDAAAEDGGLDLSMKKKKKKKVPKEGEEDDFAAKLKALELKDEAEAEAAPEEAADEGDMEAGTGIWQHDENKPLSYTLLLDRFFHQLSQKNPDHALSGTKSYKIPPPQCVREGNKKTIFANIAEIAKRMKRTDEHVTQYLFSELGTSGSVDGSRRLVIKGRFQQKQIENVLRKYISQSAPRLPFCVTMAVLTTPQSSTSPARHASPLTRSSTRVRTVSTSSTATTAVPGELSRPSRRVSQPRSARERRCRVKRPALDVVSSLLAVLAVLACSFSCTCYRFSVDWDAT